MAEKKLRHVILSFPDKDLQLGPCEMDLTSVTAIVSPPKPFNEYPFVKEQILGPPGVLEYIPPSEEQEYLFLRTDDERLHPKIGEAIIDMLMRVFEELGKARWKHCNEIQLSNHENTVLVFRRTKEVEQEQSTPYCGENIDKEIAGERRMGELMRGVLENIIKGWLSEAAKRGKMGDGSDTVVATVLNQCATELKTNFDM